MDLYTLLIAQSLGEPKVRASINGARRPNQAEESLPAIDFSLLADVRREQSEKARREGRFVPGAAIRATA
jgi:aryl-alcohol dehydrogenase-like predicted oxidoreductase